MDPDRYEKKDDKKNNLNLVILSVVLVGILLGLIFIPNAIKKNQLENDKYNNFEFVKQSDNFWYTVVNKGNQPYSVPFYYHPRELEDIVVEDRIRAKFFETKENNGEIYITLDPDGTDNKIVVAGVEIARITGERFGLLNVPTHSAFIKTPSNIKVDMQVPIKTCNDANNKTMIIWLTVSNKNLVSSDGNCIRVEAVSYNDTVRVADRLMYNLLGIMN
jgi:hypothetical protein